MKHIIVFTAVAALLSLSVNAADPTPKEAVTSAAKALGSSTNYSWKTTVVVPEGSPFRPGPTEGQFEKDGVTSIKMSFGDNTTRAFLKGEKAAVSNPEGGWQSLSEVQNAEGPGRFIGMMLHSFKAPVAQAEQLVAASKELKTDGDAIAADLTEDGAKTLLSMRPRNGDGPSISNAKGSVKFWIKDGVLIKYEFKVKGSVSFNGNDMEIDRTTTVEIKDVGTTKVTVPDEAKKKLE